MRWGWLVAIVVLVMGASITFGNRGLMDSLSLSKRLEELQTENGRIAKANESLRQTVLLLRDNLPYIEMVARDDLGMVRKDDLVFRFSQEAR